MTDEIELDPPYGVVNPGGVVVRFSTLESARQWAKQGGMVVRLHAVPVPDPLVPPVITNPFQPRDEYGLVSGGRVSLEDAQSVASARWVHNVVTGQWWGLDDSGGWTEVES
jgi:hypothetical protein